MKLDMHTQCCFDFYQPFVKKFAVNKINTPKESWWYQFHRFEKLILLFAIFDSLDPNLFDDIKRNMQPCSILLFSTIIFLILIMLTIYSTISIIRTTVQRIRSSKIPLRELSYTTITKSINNFNENNHTLYKKEKKDSSIFRLCCVQRMSSIDDVPTEIFEKSLSFNTKPNPKQKVKHNKNEYKCFPCNYNKTHDGRPRLVNNGRSGDTNNDATLTDLESVRTPMQELTDKFSSILSFKLKRKKSPTMNLNQKSRATDTSESNTKHDKVLEIDIDKIRQRSNNRANDTLNSMSAEDQLLSESNCVEKPIGEWRSGLQCNCKHRRKKKHKHHRKNYPNEYGEEYNPPQSQWPCEGVYDLSGQLNHPCVQPLDPAIFRPLGGMYGGVGGVGGVGGGMDYQMDQGPAFSYPYTYHGWECC